MFKLSELVIKARHEELTHFASVRAGRPAPPDVRLRDRLAARFRGHLLDQLLAREVPASTTPALSTRARILTSPKVRGSLARQVRELLRHGQGDEVRASRLHPRRSAVIEASAELEALARRLVEGRPVDARGVAQVGLFIADGTGPLYWRDAAETLRTVSKRALDNLTPATA